MKNKFIVFAVFVFIVIAVIERFFISFLPLWLDVVFMVAIVVGLIFFKVLEKK